MTEEEKKEKRKQYLKEYHQNSETYKEYRKKWAQTEKRKAYEKEYNAR